MNSIFTRAALLLIACLIAASAAWAAGQERERMPAREDVEEMLADLPAAAAGLPAQSPVREAVEAGQLDLAREMLRFRPLAEAPLPEGFPAFTPVGVIEVKEYPAYRKAVGPAFWTLFNHIQRRDIPMTAPVEMNQASESGQSPMAFLYQSTGVGALGEVDGVEVQDTPAAVVVSIGARGRMTDEMSTDLRRRLEAWLADNPKHQAAGEDAFRLFGYNSPMVPNDQKYWEAQIVIEPAGD